MIGHFCGRYRFLSNFWLVNVKLDGIIYPSVEHAYQASKTLDHSIRTRYFTVGSPGEARRAGRRLSLRKDWERVRLDIMYDLLKQKFADPVLRQQLLELGGQELVEGNNWGDGFWGVCDGKGHNHLGRLLMRVRYEMNE